MKSIIDPIELAKALIAAPSVTPAAGAVFDVLEAAIKPLGFAVERWVTEGVENLVAVRGADNDAHTAPHFAFAGHLDVVPPGEGWTSDAFTPEVRGDLLYGRGAVDMKSSIAAFVAAAAQVDTRGTISLLITGDEEGEADHGTREIIKRIQARGQVPDLCLVGEPTSVKRLGDMIKIGRRGSTNIWITVPGVQGHVAYPHLADNPIPKLVRILSAIDAIKLDDGDDWFQPSNIEVTEIEVGNKATNVIPAQARARLSIRFNDQQRGDDLIARIADVAQSVAPNAVVTGKVYGEAFFTPPGKLSATISAAIEKQTGAAPELSTSGGTSDARFLSKLSPVVEFGLCNATMHKLDEAVALADITALTAIYADIIRAIDAE
jgi:succinyl-diaminopimelate desuccinylase